MKKVVSQLRQENGTLAMNEIINVIYNKKNGS